jgi:TIR domain
MSGPTVFISYSHQDETWKDQLVRQLKVLELEGAFEVWDDRKIAAGDGRHAEIETAMERARVAVLLVSADFLTSDFIRGTEVPSLLQRRAKDGLRIIPLIVRPCPWQAVEWLSETQCRPKDCRPLSRGQKAKAEEDLAALALEIRDLLRKPAEFARLDSAARDKETVGVDFPGQLMGQGTLLAKNVFTYVVALAALYGMTWWRFKANLLYVMEKDTWQPWPQIALLLLPLLIVAIPLSFQYVERRRFKRLRRLALATDQYRPGYFRLEPYEEADVASFTRSDGAHKRVLSWLVDDRQPSFRYLTGASGSGKTSLLQAFVLPKLREKGRVVISLRAREDGVARLTYALRSEGTVWKNPPDISEPRELLERAAGALRRSEKRLLLLVDQFEELYILESEAELGRVDEKTASEQAGARERFVRLLRSLSERPIEGVVVLLSMRKDYEDKVVEHYGLPSIRQGENRRTIELFNVPAAVSFLRGSGTVLTDDVLRDLLEGAGRVEDQPGLFRPVLLNLIGLQLVRSQGILPCPADRIISHYLLSSIRRQNLRDIARSLLEPLVSDQGTALAKSLDKLEVVARRPRLEIKGMLRALRDDGLVRPLDTAEETWQITHDFLARQIGLLLGRLRRPWWQTIAIATTPALVVAFAGLLLAGLPLWSRAQAFQELRELRVDVVEEDGAIQITSRNQEYLARIANAAQVVETTKLDLSHSNIDDLEPLRGLTRLNHLDLSFSEVSNLEPLKGLTGLIWLDLKGTNVRSLEPLRGLASLRYLDVRSTRLTDTDLAPLRSRKHLKIQLSNR